jgi:penicillin-insensitive murein endopeptidase
MRIIILEPLLQPQLFKTKHGAYLREHLSFSRKRSWVRHDEHYHVDFIVPYRPL